MPHTPGRWLLAESEEGHEIRMGSAILDSASHQPHHVIEYDHACDPEEETEWYEEARANARLIAAAPDLLAGLAPIADWLGDEVPDEGWNNTIWNVPITVPQLRAIVAAVALARGEGKP